MDFGKIEYIRAGKAAAGRRALRLTLVAHDDETELQRAGMRGLRLRRIIRLTREASEQGAPLSYSDLSALLLTSLATLKRDISHLQAQGISVPLRRRRNAANGLASSRTPADGGQDTAGGSGI